VTRRAAIITVVVLSSLAALRTPSPAAPVVPAEEVMRKNVESAFAVLKDKTLSGRANRPQRIAALRRVADRAFDWAEMARSSLGAPWRNLNATQRARFVDVFKDVLAAQYMDDIDRFQGTETVTIDGSTAQGEDVLVRSTLVSASRDRIPIDYLLRNEQGQWMVVDLSIERVSLVNHFRKTFSGALANMSIDQLIERLRQQLPRSL
jgi:phospholipid transport system substrate-binding protein